MLRTRVLTAVVALPILIALVWLGGWAFALLVSGALLIAGWEYVHLLRQGGYSPPLWLTWALIALAVGTVRFAHETWRTPAMAGLALLGVGHAVWRMERGASAPVHDMALAFFGGVYIGWLGSTLLAIRRLPHGAYFVALVYGCVASADSAAYFVGRQWGRHKLSPRVSPKKTWEGYAGGVVAAALFGAVMGAFAPESALTWAHGATLGASIGMLGTVGDLGISAIKRQVNAKDSGHLIPGHGGVLDRVDSVLVAAPVGYFYLVWFVLP